MRFNKFYRSFSPRWLGKPRKTPPSRNPMGRDLQPAEEMKSCVTIRTSRASRAEFEGRNGPGVVN